VAPIRVTVAEALRYVESRLRENGTAAFRELAAGCPERIHVVMRFLALLELYREGKVDLSQARTFGDIEVRWRTGEAV
jgi:segregation and condensation protein A